MGKGRELVEMGRLSELESEFAKEMQRSLDECTVYITYKN